MSSDKYAQRGVSSGKEEVHDAISGLDKGLFPLAFCKILPDVAGGDPAWCNLMHADTAGTKTSLAYLYWKETGDLSVWEGIAQDALVMNLDDMACVGCTSDILVSSTIARNKHLISGDVIATLIRWLESFTEEMSRWGVRIYPAGGETADVGDIVRTLDVGYSTFARMRRHDLLVNDIRPGLQVIGFASYGKAAWEGAYNSGMGSNGLTSARHDVLHGSYARQFPESFAPETPSEVVYSGSYRLTDKVEFPEGTYEVGRLLLSPTRTYLPLIARMMAEVRPAIKGMIHCTGGGQGKVGKFITEGLVRKEDLLPVPPVFRLIAEQSEASNSEMFRVFNMGQRLECYVDPAATEDILALASELQVEAKVIGEVVPSDSPGVEVHHQGEIIRYPVK